MGFTENELVTTNHVSFADMQKMADTMAKSRLFPSCQTPENALALMLLCQSEGIHPAQAARRFHIIKGTCAMRADAMLAEFQRQGGKVQWTKYDAVEARATFEHPSGGKVDFAYSINDAKTAGLIRPDSGWSKFPAAMLRARCISGGIRMVLPGVVCGVYTPEEVEDFDGPGKQQKQSKPEAKSESKPQSMSEKIGFSQAEIAEFVPVQPVPALQTKPEDQKPEIQQPEPPKAPAAQVGNIGQEIVEIRANIIKLGIKTREDYLATVSALAERDLIKDPTDLTPEQRQMVLAKIRVMIADKENEKKVAA